MRYVIHIPLSGISIVASVNDTLPARARGHLRSCLRLTNPCAKRKVLSLTKPKVKIYKTKSLVCYIKNIHISLLLLEYIYVCVCVCVSKYGKRKMLYEKMFRSLYSTIISAMLIGMLYLLN